MFKLQTRPAPDTAIPVPDTALPKPIIAARRGRNVPAPPTDEEWRRFRAEGDLPTRNQMVEQYMPLVRSMARRMDRRTHAGVEYDDLVSAGAIGLMQAVERFDPARGWRFVTFASRRIRGAMLDHQRKQSGVPQSTRTLARKLAIARATVQSRLGHRASEAEIAEELGLDAAEYQAWRLGSVREVLPLTSDVPDRPSDVGQDMMVGAPWLSEAIEQLPDNERTVIRLGYFENLPNTQVAGVLGVSPSRVSQIRTRALARLRDAGSMRQAV